jgi:hypothetical protein
MEHYIKPTELLLLLALFGSPIYGAALTLQQKPGIRLTRL